MTITEGRLARFKKKQAHRKKIFGTTYGAVITLFIIASLSMIVSITYLYRSTKKWESSQSHIQMANIDPEYVTDYPTVDAKAFVEMSEKVNAALKSVEENKKRPENGDDIVKESTAFIQKHHLENSALQSSTERLTTYLEYFDVTNTAYTNPNTTKLKEIYSKLSDYVIESDRSLDKEMIDALNNIINNYDAMNSFIVNVLPKYGEVKDDKYVIPSTVSELDSLSEEAEKLKMFPTATTFLTELQTQKDSIMKNNKVHAANLNYLEFKALVKKLDGLYVQRATIKTYEDVVKNGWKVDGKHKNSDKVKEIVYNGIRVEDTDWIRLDAKPDIVFEESTKPNQGQNQQTQNQSQNQNQNPNQTQTTTNAQTQPSSSENPATTTESSETTRSRNER